MTRVKRNRCPYCRKMSPFYLISSHMRLCKEDQDAAIKEARADRGARLNAMLRGCDPPGLND